MADITSEQKKLIDARIEKEGLNEYGDPKGTVYMGGTPLFDEMSGEQRDRYEYIVENHPEWVASSK